MFSFAQLRKSLSFAFHGLKYVFENEQNFRVQVFIFFLASIFMIIFKVHILEAAAVIFASMFVLVLELINSIFERFADIVKPRMHSYVKIIKDVMAAAVLLSSLAALAIGILIFFPYFQKAFFS